MGASKWPPSPQPSERPGGAVALLWCARGWEAPLSARVRSAWELLVYPGDHQAAPVVMPDVRREVLHVGLPGRHGAHRRRVLVVDLLGPIALNVVDDLPPLADVECAPLQANHLGRLRVVDTRRVQRLAGDVGGVEGQVGDRGSPLAGCWRVSRADRRWRST